MAATNWTINGDSPTPVAEFALPYDLFLYNADPANAVYLDDTRGMLASSGAILPPLSTKIWKAGDPCFAICDAGLTARVNASKNSGDLQNPAAIATSILTQGLAQQIATNINLLGVPPIDRAAVIVSTSEVVPINTDFITPVFDVSQYQSLSIDIFEVNGAPGSLGTPRQMFALYYADAGATQFIAGDMYYYMPSHGKVIASPVQSRGPYMTLRFEGVAGGAANGTIDYKIVGSYRTTTRPRVEFTNAQPVVNTLESGDSGMWIASGNYPVGASSEWPFTYAGSATLSWLTNAVAGAACNMIISDIVNNTSIFQQTFPVSAAVGTGMINMIELPLRPMRINITNNTGAPWGARFALMMNGAL